MCRRLHSNSAPSARSSLAQNTASISGALASRSANSVPPSVTEVGTGVVTTRRRIEQRRRPSWRPGSRRSRRCTRGSMRAPRKPIRRHPCARRWEIAAWQASKCENPIIMSTGFGPISMIWTIGQSTDFHDRAGVRRLVDAGHDQPGRLLRQEQPQQLLFLQDAVARIGKLDAVAAAVRARHRCRAARRRTRCW